MEYITKKVPKETDTVIKYVQAQEQLEKGERITEAEVINMAVQHIAKERYGYKQKSKRRYKLSDIIGLSKSKVKSSEEDIDKVVYGI